MNILLTGATGFLGYRILEVLVINPEIKLIIANGRSLIPSRKVTHDKVKYFLGDLSKIDFVHSLSHHLLPISFSNIWLRKDTMNLRNMLDYNIPFARLKFSQRLPLHIFPKVWNDLDEPEIKNTYDKTKFRSMLKTYFLDKLHENVLCNNSFRRQCNLAL